VNAENGLCWSTNAAQTDHTEEELPLHAARTSTSMNNDDIDSFFLMEPLANDTNLTINVCPAFDIPPFANSASRPVFYPRLPTPVSNSVITSPLATPTNPSTSGVLFDGHQIPSTLELQQMSLPKKIIFYGTNPENIIPSIQMMRKLFHCLQDDTFQRQHISFHGMSAWELYGEIISKVLLSEIDDVARWAYQASATTVQQGADHQSSCMDIQPFAQRRENNPEQMSQVQARRASTESNSARLDGTLTSSCHLRTNCTTGGALQIQLRRAPKEISDRDEGDSQITLTICAIPEIRNRAGAGIHVTIPRSSQGLPIYTTIREFNVVPKDSEIISCVRMNDLEGVRRLIGEKKASPRDVDPSGTSLLSVGLRLFQYLALTILTVTIVCNTFRFLRDISIAAERGSKHRPMYRVRNPILSLFCDAIKLIQVFRLGIVTNLIDFIWYCHLELAGRYEFCYIGLSTSYSTYFDRCRSMTELALANGCLAGEPGPFHMQATTPLFRLSGIVVKEFTRRQVSDTLKQILYAEYDKEVRNDNGETALLYAALLLRSRSLTVVELLLAEDPNIHAVENQGRGALHLCLWFSVGLQNSFYQVCRGPSSAQNGRFVAEHFTTTDTFEARSVDLEHSDSDMEEGLPSDHINCHNDEESDVDCAECDSQDLYDGTYDSPRLQKCYWCGESNEIEDTGFLDDKILREDGPECHYYCADRDIDDFNMPETPDSEPEPWMCKAKSRLKLLALLKAGCCPNALDCEGLSPSDYARAEGLWPQWEWALSKGGFRYNESADSWERGS
jgi:hypothetical protein